MSNNTPVLMELLQGTYYWCSCGRSKNGPFCDGAHKGTGKEPVPFMVTEKKQMALCTCKRTKKPPVCDGTHAKVD